MAIPIESAADGLVQDIEGARAAEIERISKVHGLNQAEAKDLLLEAFVDGMPIEIEVDILGIKPLKIESKKK